MDFFGREMELRKRALAVLGLDEDKDFSDADDIKAAYRERMRQVHPDANIDKAGDPKVHLMAALCNEAYNLLRGKLKSPTLLSDDELVEAALGRGVTALEDLPSYQDWLMKRFYNTDQASIWPI